ncbi:MAG: recombinase family protein [Ignavibacteriaceae bacterium]|nr:recombinase family protein [Ignavibacteriaceae bacterium]
MKTIGYVRVSSDKQDLNKQRHLLLEHAQKIQVVINEFIEIEISSRKTVTERKIDQLISSLDHGDLLIVAELSRLGRNMFETLGIINQLLEKGVLIDFIRQPELSTYRNSHHVKLLLAIYSYFADSEREFISIRTKQGLEAVKAKGVKLGRPKGSKNKKGRALDPFREQILEYQQMGLPVASIMKIVNNQLEEKLSYNTFKIFISQYVN